MRDYRIAWDMNMNTITDVVHSSGERCGENAMEVVGAFVLPMNVVGEQGRM